MRAATDLVLQEPPLRASPEGPRRRRAPLQAAADPAPGMELPEPPSPPFERTADGWTATLPGRLGSRSTVEVTRRGLRLGGTFVAFDEIAHATLSLGSADDQGVSVRYVLETYAGRTVKLRTSSLRGKAAESFYDVADHVWLLLREVVAPRLRAPLVDAVADGRTIELAGLLLGPEGMAAARRPDVVVGWRHIGDAVVDRRMVVVPAGVKVLKTPLASCDSVLLLDLPTEVRARLLRR